jgi:hypothetical protein
LLAAFSQVYSENKDQKAEKKDLSNVQLGQKVARLHLWARRVWLLKKLMP